MDKISFSVQYDDKEYSEALEKALLIACDSLISSPDPFLTVDESLIPKYQPLRAYIDKISSVAERPCGAAKPHENVLYTAFSAAVGGSGLTTTAIAYARIASRILGKNVAFISFDPDIRQSLPERDEFGVAYYSKLPLDSCIDELVLDVGCGADVRHRLPCGIDAESSWDVLDLSERRVVVKGFDEKRHAAADEYMRQLLASSEKYLRRPVTLSFENHFEEAPDPSDIHSQLGKEVLALAEKLEGKQTKAQCS